jgi:Na+/melibiose symporter-like transporter
MFLTAFANLKETVTARRQRLSLRQSWTALRGNGPWLITFASSLLFWIAFIARISAAPFFFEYVMHRRDLVSAANSLDVVSLASILLLPWFCRRTSKRIVWLVGLVGSAAAQALVYWGAERASVGLVMTGWTMGFLTSGVAMALPFSILATTVDYGEWKTGIRAAGFLTAIGAAFCLKVGSGVGGALPAWIMAHYAYVPDVAQTARSIEGIDLSCIALPALTYALAMIPVLFYARYEREEETVSRTLAERRGTVEALSQI